MRAGEYLSAMEYPGRLIVAGTEESGKPFLAYAITGRSNNSRNRIMTEECGFIRTKAYDETLVELDMYEDVLESITAKELRDEFRRCFDTDRYMILSLGPFESD